MKNKFFHLLLLAVLLCTAGAAQITTYNLNWGTAFVPAWSNGATSGTALNTGGSGVTTLVTITRSGGSWGRVNPDGSGVNTPTVSGSTYKAGPFTAPNNLMIAVDYTSNTQYTDVTINFTPGVSYLNFYMGDVDRYFQGRLDFVDQLIVEGNGGTVHPSFSRYFIDPKFPNQLLFIGDTVMTNPDENQSGNAGLPPYDAHIDAGTVYVYFGAQIVNSLRIRYNNVRPSISGVLSNPYYQAIAISNLNFAQASALPVNLLSFHAFKTHEGNRLEWKTDRETDMAHYSIERSEDGTSFNEIGRQLPYGATTATTYSFQDQTAKGSTTYYRLRMAATNGTVSYSNIVVVKTTADEFTVNQLYPTVFNEQLNLNLSVPSSDKVQLSLMNLNGAVISRQEYTATRGSNTIQFPAPAGLAGGQYLVQVRYRQDSKTLTVFKK